MWALVLILVMQTPPDPCTQGKLQARRNFDWKARAAWLTAGAFTGPIALIAAYATTHTPQETDSFTRCYARETRKLRAGYALTGCAITAAVVGCPALRGCGTVEIGEIGCTTSGTEGCGAPSGGGCSSDTGYSGASSGGCSSGSSGSSGGCS